MATATAALLNALVIGGTGATGKCLMGVLLRDKERFGKVVLVTRRKLESVAEEYKVNLTEEEESGRLVQHVQDLDEITKEKISELCTGCHVFFNTLGTTRAAAGSSQAFYHIDCEIPFKFAEAAKEAGVSHVSLLTSIGSKSNSILLYLRTKGELEEKVRGLQFPHTSIFQPGGLNRGQTDRILEKIAGFFFKGLPVSSLAEAMAWDAAVSAQKGQTSGEPTVIVIDSKRAFNESAQEYHNILFPKATKEGKAEGAEPQTEATQPKEGESPPQVQQSKAEEIQPQAEEDQPQDKEVQPQTEEAQLQAEEDQPQDKEDQPQTDVAQPQDKEDQPQTEEVQPQAEEDQPQDKEDQPHTEEAQPQAEEDQPQVDETQKEDTNSQAKETETNAEED